MSDKFFVHDSSYIDEDVKIGKNVKYGILRTYKAEPRLGKIQRSGRT